MIHKNHIPLQTFNVENNIFSDFEKLCSSLSSFKKIWNRQGNLFSKILKNFTGFIWHKNCRLFGK